MEKLHDELILHIMLFMDAASLGEFGSLSNHCRHLVTSKELWQSKLQYCYPRFTVTRAVNSNMEVFSILDLFMTQYGSLENCPDIFRKMLCRLKINEPSTFSNPTLTR